MATKKAWVKKGISGNPLWKPETVGAAIEGIYRGSRHIEKVDSEMHTIETETGIFDFWGSGLLNFLLKDEQDGAEIRVVYQGMKKATVQIGKKSVKKDCHQYDVFTR